MEDQPLEPQPKRRGGWPKGRPRGPRSTTPSVPGSSPPSQPVATASYEPVQVEAITVSGERFSLAATSFSVENGRYLFVSFPEQRGFKTVTVLKADQMAMLKVTAPDEMCDRLKSVPASAQLIAGSGLVPEPVTYGPPMPLVKPNYSGGDPRRFVPPEVAQDMPNPAGIPVSRISKGEDGVPEIIGATMR